MADNVAITAGSGTSIATDDVSGAHYQKMKIYNAGDGVSTALFPDSAALADDVANMTTPIVGAAMMAYGPDGATAEWHRVRMATLCIAVDASSANTQFQAIAAPGAGRKIRLLSFHLAGGTNSRLLLQSASTIFGYSWITANTVTNGDFGLLGKLLGDNEAFNIDRDQTTTVSGYVMYCIE